MTSLNQRVYLNHNPMTEIKIERTKRPIWPWIVVAIVAIVLIVMLAFWQAETPEEDYDAVPDTEQVDPALPESQPDNN